MSLWYNAEQVTQMNTSFGDKAIEQLKALPSEMRFTTSNDADSRSTNVP